MRYIPGNAQHIGGREEQQDAFGFSDPRDRKFLRHGGFLGVLADGMGGLSLGSEASGTAVHTFLRAYRNKSPQAAIPDALEQALIAANDAVLSLARSKGQEDNAGTTLAAAVAHRDCLYWIAAGDSRIYLLREGRLTQLTTDHVYANELAVEVANGAISRTEALHHPDRDVLTSYLGLAALSEIDRNVRPFPLLPGDRVLLCSDGLYKMLPEDEMVAALAGGPQQASEQLIGRALERESPRQDNVTALVIECAQAGAAFAVDIQRGRAKALLLSLAVMLLLVIGGAAVWWRLQPPKVEDERQVDSQMKPGDAQAGEDPGGKADKQAKKDRKKKGKSSKAKRPQAKNGKEAQN